MATRENPYAGQGPVLLDIGGTVGALVVTMPGSADGLEVELRATDVGAAQPDGHPHPRDGAPHSHHGAPHAHSGTHHPHVGVVGRPTGAGTVFSLVYPAVEEGEYRLFPLPEGDALLTVHVAGGAVTQASWPG
jgi:hypothetical protein